MKNKLIASSIGCIFFFTGVNSVIAQQITAAGAPAQLDIRQAAANSIRITLKPLSYKDPFPFSPAVAEKSDVTGKSDVTSKGDVTGKSDSKPVISLTALTTPVKKQVGNLTVLITGSPLTISISNKKGEPVQDIRFEADGNLSFATYNQPILGLGEGGPKPGRGVNWRSLPIQFDRRGELDSMQPRWQADAYGSRNPAAMMTGTAGWGLFVAAPWVLVDLRDQERGICIPWKPAPGAASPQTEKNQQLNAGKGMPPADKIIPGLYDFFVFDAHDPASLMKDFSTITGPAAMPPKWALGYMQSHRTLNDEYQMIGIVDTFRNKKIPVDAVIYLGTGFAPVGWNTKQPSFDFNPEVFKRDPTQFFTEMHNRNVKTIVHMVPWDRDRLPSLQGSIPVKRGETVDASHISEYWKQHIPLMQAGVDGFWPDEGDWFNLHERVKRHQLYYQGQLSTYPDLRPWSLQRNGYPGIAQWGGWVWSGDTESSWKTLEGQIAVGINYSLSIAPYWGSDIGGFYSNQELTGELYARWFQFAAFCGSFRSHGRTWRTRLPWGWGLSYMGPSEDRQPPLESELNNPAIEPIARQYDELRYQLLPYTYTLAWEARTTGMPLMRALWLHYPGDEKARSNGSEYLWGRDLLIAPVFEKGATSKDVYLPAGDWYDWWTGEKQAGGKTVTRKVDLATMPIYVRAGAIIPIDPVRQYTAQKVDEPTTIRIYQGANGKFVLYDDDGISQEYLKGAGHQTSFIWTEATRELSVTTTSSEKRDLIIQLYPGNSIKKISLAKTAKVKF